MGKKWIVLVFAACSFFYTHGQVSGYLGKRLGVGLTNATQLSLENPIGSTTRLDEIPALGLVHNPALGIQYALSRRTSVGVSAGVFQTGLYIDNLYAGFLDGSSTIGLVVNAVGLYRLNCQTVQM